MTAILRACYYLRSVGTTSIPNFMKIRQLVISEDRHMGWYSWPLFLAAVRFHESPRTVETREQCISVHWLQILKENLLKCRHANVLSKTLWQDGQCRASYFQKMWLVLQGSQRKSNREYQYREYQWTTAHSTQISSSLQTLSWTNDESFKTVLQSTGQEKIPAMGWQLWFGSRGMLTIR
jgi:hypothetical protein